jgi:hypothetical protein
MRPISTLTSGITAPVLGGLRDYARYPIDPTTIAQYEVQVEQHISCSACAKCCDMVSIDR